MSLEESHTDSWILNKKHKEIKKVSRSLTFAIRKRKKMAHITRRKFKKGYSYLAQVKRVGFKTVSKSAIRSHFCIQYY